MFTHEVKKKINKEWNIDAHDIYGLTEMCGPGVSADCDEHDGLHLWEDHFFPEIINPATCDCLGPNEEGELVLTTLTKEGMPILRYRTRDITFLYDDICSCGRTHVRHAPIKGRSDDMIIIKGTNIFPSQIEEAVMKFSQVGSNWRMILEHVETSDSILVEVETKDASNDRQKEQLLAAIKKEIRLITTLGVNVSVLDPGILPVSEGKAHRVIDRRN